MKVKTKRANKLRFKSKPALKHVRKDAGYSQWIMAELISTALGEQVTNQRYSRWERGKRNVDVRVALIIREILQCRLDYIFQYKDEEFHRVSIKDESENGEVKVRAGLKENMLENIRE